MLVETRGNAGLDVGQDQSLPAFVTSEVLGTWMIGAVSRQVGTLVCCSERLNQDTGYMPSVLGLEPDPALMPL